MPGVLSAEPRLIWILLTAVKFVVAKTHLRMLIRLMEMLRLWISSVIILHGIGAWMSDLDDNGLSVQSISIKSAFDEDMVHFDRMCCHLGTSRVVQICVVDKDLLLVVDYDEDMIELCIPGSAIGCSDPFESDSLSLLLYEQTGIVIVDGSRFKFVGYSDLSDKKDSKSVWYYFEITPADDDEFSNAMTEEDAPVSWIEQCLWSNMNVLRAAESSIYFELKSERLQNGFEVDSLDSEEFA